MLGIGLDVVFTEWLARGVHHADDPLAERMGVVADELLGMRAKSQDGYQKISVSHPKSTVIAVNDATGTLEHLLQEGAGGVIDFKGHLLEVNK